LRLKLPLLQVAVETAFTAGCSWNCLYCRLQLKLPLLQIAFETAFTAGCGWNCLLLS